MFCEHLNHWNPLQQRQSQLVVFFFFAFSTESIFASVKYKLGANYEVLTLCVVVSLLKSCAHAESEEKRRMKIYHGLLTEQ